MEITIEVAKIIVDEGLKRATPEQVARIVEIFYPGSEAMKVNGFDEDGDEYVKIAVNPCVAVDIVEALTVWVRGAAR